MTPAPWEPNVAAHEPVALHYAPPCRHTSEPPNCTPAAARRPGWRWRRERTFCVPGRVGKDELSERALCQAARAQIAAPQQDLHLRGLAGWNRTGHGL